MKVLVACEQSGVVREAFRALGHDAWSCDIVASEGSNEHHIIGDARNWTDSRWDLLIAHPPCTRLCCSGARWFSKFPEEQKEAIELFTFFINAPIKLKAVENPIGIMSTLCRKPSQIIQPWQFGHGETKATCLWLTGLPLLLPTNIVSGREARIHRLPPSADRGKIRSRTYQGIADAMASQWGSIK